MCRIRLYLGDYPLWFLTLSRQGICCLNSVQDLQGYDLHKWLSSSPSSKIEIGVSKGLSILGFLKGYEPLGYKISGLQWRRNKSPSAKSRRVFKLRIYLSTDKVFESLNSQAWLDFHYDIEWLRFQTGLFKCLIASMAGFLLWLSVTNIMIEVFKVALAQWILFYQWIWFILQWKG